MRALSVRCSTSLDTIYFTAGHKQWNYSSNFNWDYIPSIRRVTDPEAVYLSMTAVDSVNNAKAQHKRWKDEIASRKGDEILQKIKKDVKGISRFQVFKLGDFPDKAVRFRGVSFDMTGLTDGSDSDSTLSGETIPKAYPLTDYVWGRNDRKENAETPEPYSRKAQKESTPAFGSPSEASVTGMDRSS